MKLKKVFIILLSAVIIFNITGCTGGTGIDGVPKEIENPNPSDGINTEGVPIQLTVYSQTANYSGKLAGWFAKIMLDKFNVEMTIIPQPDPGIFDTRMESGFLGDIIIFNSSGNQYQRAVNEGALFDWNDNGVLDEFGAYIKEAAPYAIEHNMDISERITGEKTLYGIGFDIATTSGDIVAPLYTWDIRWDLYKELGYPEINNLNDMYDLFVEMKKINPTDANGNETYAVSMWPDWDSNMVMYVKAFATAYWGYDELGLGLFNVENGDFYYAIDEDGPYYKSLQFFNRLFRAGLVDPNSMTQTVGTRGTKLLADGIFFCMFSYAGSLTYNTPENLEAGRFMYSLIPTEATPIAEAMSVKGGSRVWAIGANSDYPELCMAIINWLATPEGTMTYFNGPKDLCWYYDDEGYTHFTELGERASRDPRNTAMPQEWGGGLYLDGSFTANNTVWSWNATNPDSNGEKFNPAFWASRRTEAEYSIIQDWRDYTGFYDFDEYFRSRTYKIAQAPASGYVESKRSTELDIIWSQIARCVVDQSWRAVYADTEAEFEKIFENMRKQVMEYDPDGTALQWCLDEAAERYSKKPR